MAVSSGRQGLALASAVGRTWVNMQLMSQKIGIKIDEQNRMVIVLVAGPPHSAAVTQRQ
jgi:hypothetical protein